MKNIGESIATILASIIGLAVLAVIVSNNSQTTGVLTATFNGLAQLLQVVTSPITSSTSSSTTTGSAQSNINNSLALLGLGGSGTGTGVVL